MSEEACDFCTRRTLVVATLRCRPFLVVYSNGGIQADDGQWATCAICLKLVEAKDIDGLVRRCLANNPPYSIREAKYIFGNLRVLLGSFMANRIDDR